jgi:hypothetical protein
MVRLEFVIFRMDWRKLLKFFTPAISIVLKEPPNIYIVTSMPILLPWNLHA